MSAPILSATPVSIERAASCLRDGGLVAMPTETVYGMACDAANPKAVARLYAAKQRPNFNPLIAHVSGLEMASSEANLTDISVKLIDRFWPGPLSIVAPMSPNGSVCDLARAGLDSIALRQPNHGVAAALLKAFGAPIVAPSANPSGQISPTTAEHVAADLGDKIDLILDGGPCRVGLESTIIDTRQAPATLLRPGGIDGAEIEAVIGPLRSDDTDPAAPISPGQLLRHYAPTQPLRLNAKAPKGNEVFLGFGPVAGRSEYDLNLSPSSDLHEAAANLFSMLRMADSHGRPIAAAPIPMTGPGIAINDRLHRAANRV